MGGITMGEIAEMMLDGFLDEETGEVIDGEAPGYPRRMSACPTCQRLFRDDKGLGQHRAAKGH